MLKALKKYLYLLLVIIYVLLFQSCKTDEFKFDEITIKEDFGVKIITPMFSGKDKQGNVLEFRDYIHDWKKPIPDNSNPFTVLQYSNGTFKTIPTRLIFDPSVIIDSLEFLIQGRYSIEEIELVFIVANSCPFPLNLQLQFLVRNGLNNTVPPVSPPPFPEADFSLIPVNPVTTIHTVRLDSLQTKNFIDSKNIKLTSWFDQTNFINQNDTLSAHYPIDLSIALIGFVKKTNE